MLDCRIKNYASMLNGTKYYYVNHIRSRILQMVRNSIAHGYHVVCSIMATVLEITVLFSFMYLG